MPFEHCHCARSSWAARPLMQHRIVAKLDASQAEVDALKRLQAETAGKQALHAPLDALLPPLWIKHSKEK
jgi:hypothetical protein